MSYNNSMEFYYDKIKNHLDNPNTSRIVTVINEFTTEIMYVSGDCVVVIEKNNIYKVGMLVHMCYTIEIVGNRMWNTVGSEDLFNFSDKYPVLLYN